MSNKETVKAIYDAFQRGDIPFILNRLADNVQWNYAVNNTAQDAGVPWTTLCSGRDDVLNFFKAVAESEVNKFDILSLLGEGNEVVGRLNIASKYYDDEIVHFWTFNDEGKVIRYQMFLDTAQHIAGYEKAQKAAA